ncbi:MAG: OmpA family protein [Bacteroidota bacterium]
MRRCRPLFTLFFFLCCCLFGGTVFGQTPLGNKTARERDPVLRADGQELYFTRVDHGSNLGSNNADDIWIRPRYADGSWGRPLNPGSPINSFAHDRALALSPDGTRLAVLRRGLEDYVDLLELNGRNWRILESWPLPAEVVPFYDLTFDPNAQELIYSATGPTGSRDLFRCQALPEGRWSTPEPLTLLNGRDNETDPMLAADGRTLYFRRDGGQWLRRLTPSGGAVAVDIPARVRQFTVPAGERVAALPAVVMRNDLGEDEQLFTQALAATALPPATRLTRSFLQTPPPPGEQTALVTLNGATTLRVRPDAMLRYAVFLREGENIRAAGEVAVAGTDPSGIAAFDNAVVNAVSAERSRLEAGITQRQRELDRLDAERRRYQQDNPPPADPELEALRDQYYRTSLAAGDTLPPRTTAKGTEAARARYAAELAELERMKAKFRRQQDDKLQQRDRGNYRWSETTPTPVETPTPATNVPSIGDVYTPPVYLSPEEARRRAYADSIRVNATVRSGLYGNQAPKVYEREAWENDLRRDLPRSTPLSQEEAARLDADYQRKLQELAELKAELNRVNGTTPQTPPATPPATNPNWTTKGDPYYRPVNTAPRTYEQPVSTPRTYERPAATNPYPPTPRSTYPPAYPPATAPATGNTSTPGVPVGITFIYNTAYPDGVGYDGLDQLVRTIQQASSVVEVRVHTPAQLDRRAAQLLSEERALTIRNYLREKGVNAKHFRVLGFGNNLTGQGGERVEVLR